MTVWQSFYFIAQWVVMYEMHLLLLTFMNHARLKISILAHQKLRRRLYMFAFNHAVYFVAWAGHAASNWLTGRAMGAVFQLMPNRWQ